MAQRKSVFVDTGVFYSAFVTNSSAHDACSLLIADAKLRLLTTDYVIDELVTLLVARGQRKAAITYVPSLLSGATCEVHRVTDTDFAEAWRLVQRFTDKLWSFTDCTSYAVMQRLGITEALSLDDHFRQFGFASVLP